MAARLALIGADDQLYVADPRHGGRLQLSTNATPQVWGIASGPPSTWSWPCWSPDGQRIACLELRDGDDETGPVRVQILHTDGVQQWHALDVEHGVPLYVQWQPDGQGLLVLVQDGDELELQHVRLDRLGDARTIERGVPLFFTWHPDGQRVVVHTASGEDTRLVVRDTAGTHPDEVLPQEPGNYCAPVVADGRLVHVDRRHGTNRLLSTDLEGADEHRLLEFSGLGAVLAARDGVLFSAAPEGEGNPYRGLVRLRDGLETLTPEDSLAFFPAGDSVLLVQIDSDENCLTWKRVGPDGAQELCQFWPSRETLFFLRFFDQFVQSHRAVSQDGRALVFCGHTLDDAPRGGEPSVLLYDLDTHQLRDMGPGSFACFAPEA